jgi:hypothetical protein
MSQELQLGKYEFYPYPDDLFENAPSLEELVEILKKAIGNQSEPGAVATGLRAARTMSRKNVKTPYRSIDRRRPRRKRLG